MGNSNQDSHSRMEFIFRWREKKEEEEEKEGKGEGGTRRDRRKRNDILVDGLISGLTESWLTNKAVSISITFLFMKTVKTPYFLDQGTESIHKRKCIN